MSDRSQDFSFDEVRTLRQPGEIIGVGNGSEDVAKIQLAARWAEQFAPAEGDTMDEALRRFRRVYVYLESVTKLLEPENP